MTDMDGVLQIQMLNHRGDVRRVVVHVVSIADLRRASMPAAVVSDDAVALGQEKQQLCVPIVCAQGPAVMEDKRLRTLGPPILVEDLNPILGRHIGHGLDSLLCNGRLNGLEQPPL
ncbi:hypothetical protein D3C71_1762880 [compost metagenome]